MKVAAKKTIVSLSIFLGILIIISIYVGAIVNREQSKLWMENSYSGRIINVVSDGIVIQGEKNTFTEILISSTTKVVMGKNLVKGDDLTYDNYVMVLGKKINNYVKAEIIRIFPSPKKYSR